MAASVRDERPLVSVIVPAYRARPYLGEALDDVAAQSYRNWELVVVEDGSPDSVADVVEAFRARCSQAVRYHRQPHNQGPSVARNVAYGTVELFDDETGDTLSTWGPSPEDLACFPLSLFTRCFIQPSGVVVRRGVVARVVFKHADLIEDPHVRRQFVTRHLVTAGLGHLAYRPTPRNRLDPAVGRALLSQAVAVDPLASGARRWAWLARTSAQAGPSPLLRWVFRKGYRRLHRMPFTLSRQTA